MRGVLTGTVCRHFTKKEKTDGPKGKRNNFNLHVTFQQSPRIMHRAEHRDENMPCWYYDKKEIKNSPSYLDGIDTTTECRYRREGARFIVDAGTKLGLRYETCATGVVYFHRFYMFHSFKDFHRYVTAACCLFLAGKVEETPKKCKDIVKISQQILNPKQFAVFGNDPKEEVMTLERILLQTIKFDLQTEHPYAYLLKYAKLIKADKEKVQKLVQMSWTFINDSLCTTLSLQWEPEIIAASLMYLGTRLNKLDVTDWVGKVPGSKQKWWECIVEDLSVDLMEDVCHQVLDLYSPNNQPQSDSGESPPPPPPGQPNSASRTPNSQSSDRKRSLQSTPSDPVTPGTHPSKALKAETHSQSSGTPQKNPEKSRNSAATRQASHSQSASEHASAQPVQPISSLASSSGQQGSTGSTTNVHPGTTQYTTGSADYSQYNPYVSSSQYQSSFMSGEGAKDIQNIMGTGAQAQTSGFTQAPSQYPAYTQPPPLIPGVPQASSHQMGTQYGMQSQTYPPGYNPSQYPASGAMPGPVSQNAGQNFPQQNVSVGQHQFQGSSYPPQYQQYQNYQQQGYDQQHSQSQQHKYQGSGAYPGSQSGPRPRTSHNQSRQPHPRSSSALAQVRITGR